MTRWTIEINTVRHNPDPNYPAMAGTDDATLFARGKADGRLYRFEGRLRSCPTSAFKSVMTPVEEQPLPIAGGSARAVSSTVSTPFTCRCSTVSTAA